MSITHITSQGAEPAGDSLEAIVRPLRLCQPRLAQVPVDRLLALFDDYSQRLMRDPRTNASEGVMFLSAWLRRANLKKLIELNLNGNPAYLDGFVPLGRDYLAARPQGLVAMWMPGNVSTLPMFSVVPALLAKNACLVKLAQPEPLGIDRLLAVLGDCEVDGLRGCDLLESVGCVWFDYRRRDLNEAMSLAADVKVIWGGEAALLAISAMPRREHCVEITFGPKYSIGLIGRKRLESPDSEVDAAVDGFVRDIAIFDQRACSAPQTIFIERNDRLTLEEVGRRFARQLNRLPPKPELDAYTTMRILNCRAEWAMDESRDVLASASGANWTVCMDRELSLKEAVQSRTVFLTEIESWRDIVPLLSPKVQTVGLSMADRADAVVFAEAATAAGVARCVRPGLMNNYESPWDGKLILNQFVRWVTLKP